MRKVILGLGLAIGIVALGVGIFGLATTPYDHVVPVPYKIVSFGAVAMMGTLLILVIAFAHGTRAGDLD
ncbi:hypothetical protein [Microlunatus antarcticus]|uniref:Uncharacterized protein n=1 Tax=Microlunatus antarcticus TaxID=53388 RepID=A0A7W5P8P8_9ACTN|nr:hypothetical protein [Microlunatus antarcticus]MBB3328894.1 hypothetical protein [Microlunatus antarcticus]MBB3328963.1 hypothetical protein [Microlunatus antarcticus]